ncbi:3-oxoacyl-[acyl-carrier-protein] synthase III C-terminal domain-containing protein [Streptomyces sp. DSM 42041]|uniref:3-oxoacyl-[acyl-carrier-protein] synthase III C-terminal domain-containing protein n=1 Tax=Streptomyces hazeniae TaxID=3075538 RepID=A0ABU2NLV1_9ACTN|nr:3-oxoacyl-[acyl-carrier-protein] synthase III C-terminal domain-containing protein [Streptomyces sp. DSM 42041]MDT0377719.1 3-oxoacyl-[acyl-carrier-protein] synthase III C-terminal domain-containing protein [Streptomyces sp. DSM 42041]
MIPVSLVDVDAFLPERVVGADFYLSPDAAEADSDNHFLRAPAERRHIDPRETASQLMERAVAPMLERIRARGEDAHVDMVLTNVTIPDRIINGSGAELVNRLGLKPAPEWIIDVHNSGCISFVHMMKIARQVIASGGARSALICNVANMAGQFFARPEMRHRRHAPIPGDGCGVAFLRAGDESPILDSVTLHEPRYTYDMNLSVDTRKYWEPGEGEVDFGFTNSGVQEIVERGNRMVPRVTTELCERLGTPTADIDLLVTNQPNRMFLANWRESLGVKPERHPDTFDSYGNLFGAGVPVTLAKARDDGMLRKGDLLVLSGFAYAGDFAAATAVRW